MIHRIILCLSLSLICSCSFGQKQANNWYFGMYAGIDFDSGLPVALTNGQMGQLEGCATMSDAQGNLLFYTNGVEIYNSNHVLMLNGTGLLGSQSSSQSAIIVPAPDTDGLYYVFAVDFEGHANGLTYSKIDMSLDGGLGGVVPTEKNIQLATPVGEKVTAVYHKNQQDIWVISHRLGSNQFISYLVTSTGVQLTPVTSAVGLIHATAGGAGAVGYLKASPDGKKIASANLGGSSGVQLFDFDNESGSISNAVTLNNQASYGIEFAPNSKILYCTSMGFFSSPLFQYDISSGDEATIQSTETIIAPGYSYAALQVAIDGKIYVVRTTLGQFLSVIHNPNALGTGCNFEDGVVDLSSGSSAYGLPPFIQNYFMQEIEAEYFCSEDPTFFSIRSGIVPINCQWSFGDGSTSVELAPEHIYDEPGTYTVSVDFTTAAGPDIIHLEKAIVILSRPVATDPGDMELCDDSSNDGFESFTLSGQTPDVLGTQDPNIFAVTYHATEGEAIANEGALPMDSYTNAESPQTIYARITNTQSGCYDLTSFDLIVHTAPVITDPDALLACEEQMGEGTAAFDLTQSIAQITSGDTNVAVTFYKTQANVLNNVPINNPAAYTNTIPYNETVYFKTVNPAVPDCSATGDLGLIVTPLPVLNGNIQPYKQCDTHNPGNGVEVFDLTAMYNAITATQGLTLTYAYDDNGTLASIADPTAFQNSIPGQQTIFVSTQNEFTCDNSTSFSIIVEPLPGANDGLEFRECEVVPDQADFVLHDYDADIITGANSTVKYYSSQLGAELPDDMQLLPDVYVSGDDTVYARVENTLTGCWTVVEVVLDVVEAPIGPDQAPLEECDPNNDGQATFNIQAVLDAIAAAVPDVEAVTAHETQDDAEFSENGELGVNPITDTESYENIVQPDNSIQRIYIRVQGAGECFDIVTLDLIVHPVPEAVTPAPYALCDNGLSDTDGLANFDLTTLNDEILGTLDPLQYSVAYFTTEANAIGNVSEIDTPANYPSASTAAGAPLYARVTNLGTGCYDIVEVVLIVNPLPVANQPTPYTLCDVNLVNGLPDEKEIFDLTAKTNEIIVLPDGTLQDGLVLSFHHSLADAQGDVNAITGPTAYVNQTTIEAIYVRVEVEATGCYRVVLLDIRVAPLPQVVPPAAEDLTVCDPDGDGFAQFDLEALVEDMIDNGENVTVTFHPTAATAEAGTFPIANADDYTNVIQWGNPVYVRVVNDETGCYTATAYTLNLVVVASPALPDDPIDPIVLCDEDANDQDGITAFDLTQREGDILAFVEGDVEDYTVTYYTSEENAREGAPRITGEEAFLGTDGQVIWVRVEHVDGCYNITSFTLEVGTPLELTAPPMYSICNEAMPNDNTAEFDLTTMDNTILGPFGVGQGYTVNYYETDPRVDPGATPITPASAYDNEENPQTLTVEVITTEGCKSYTQLTIKVLPLPTPDMDPAPLALCDDDTDGSVEFDLTLAVQDITDGEANLVLSYHTTLADAEGDINPIADPEHHVSASAVVYVRVEASTGDSSDAVCYQVVELSLVVNPLPVTSPVIPPYAICEQNTDGFAEFMLSSHNEEVMGATGTTGYTIRYYLSQADAIVGTPALPNQYTNTTANIQPIFVRIDNDATGCTTIASFDLLVEEEAIAYDPAVPVLETCDDDGTNDGMHTFDLTVFNAEILNGQPQPEYSIAYFESMADAQANANAIADPANYVNTTPDTMVIYVRVTHTTTISGCPDYTEVTLIVERLAEPAITADGTTICVDYNTGNVIRPLELNSNIGAGYTFEWSLNGVPLTDADPDSPTYLAMAEGVYTVVATSTTANMCESNPSAGFTVVKSGPASPIGAGYVVSNAFSDEQVITVNVEGWGEYLYQLDNGPMQNSNVFTGVTPGEHTITVHDVKAQRFCDALVLTSVSVIDYPKFFTPNGDGYHDTWNIIGLANQADAKIYIFDRYGKLIKQIAANGEGWDGTFNGVQLPSDDYWSTVTYRENVKGIHRLKEFKAHFTLKR